MIADDAPVLFAPQRSKSDPVLIPMQITQSKVGAWTVLTLAGRIDDAGSRDLRAGLAPHLAGEALALNFSGIEYIASSGFRVLTQAAKEINAAKGKLLLGNMTDPVRRFFDIAGLSAVMKITRDVNAAISAAP